MSELIDRQAFLKQERKFYCEDCDRRKGMKNGKLTFCYEIGEAPCRACFADDVLTDLEDFPTASPWHRVEEPPKYSGKVFVWMEREGDFFDKEYIADVAYYNNLAGGRIPKGTFFKPIPGKMEYEILDNVTHWMPIEPPMEDADEP